MTAINFRGNDNLYRNAVLNCIAVLKKFPKELGIDIRQYYEEEVQNPITPSFAVIATSSKDDLRTSQAAQQIRYTINIGLEVWYYHSDLTVETKRNEVTYILWEINKLLKANFTLNGFVNKMGLEVTGARWYPKLLGTRVLAGGVITLIVKALYTSTTTF